MSDSLELYISYVRKKEGLYKNGLHVQQMRQKHAMEVKKNGFFMMNLPGEQANRENIRINLHPLPQHVNPQPLLHKHHFFELMYVYRGKCTNHFANSCIELGEGELLLLNPNTAHCPLTCTKDDCVFNIMICREFFKHSIDVLLKDNQLFSSFFIDCMFQINKARDYLYFMPGKAARDTLERLLIENFQKQICYETVIQSLLVELFAHLARSSTYSSTLPETSHERLIHKILSCIEENPADITLQKLADKFQYSQSYLSRTIKQCMGKNFSEILLDCRLHKAQYYLEQTDIPILDIALMIGFNDSSHFYKAFRGKFGETPAKYRRQYLMQQGCL